MGNFVSNREEWGIWSLIEKSGGILSLIFLLYHSCLGNLCYAGLADVSTYLNRADVLAALGVNTQYVSNWTSCDGLVYADIANNDWFNQEEVRDQRKERRESSEIK